MTVADTAGSDTGGLFAAIDNKDTASFVQYLAEDAVDGFFATIAGCRHAIGNSLRRGATRVCEGEVTYRRHDGSEITLPFANVFEYQGDLIAHYKIYIDISPLYA